MMQDHMSEPKTRCHFIAACAVVIASALSTWPGPIRAAELVKINVEQTRGPASKKVAAGFHSEVRDTVPNSLLNPLQPAGFRGVHDVIINADHQGGSTPSTLPFLG